jgi:hypothetical protein
VNLGAFSILRGHPIFLMFFLLIFFFMLEKKISKQIFWFF